MNPGWRKIPLRAILLTTRIVPTNKVFFWGGEGVLLVLFVEAEFHISQASLKFNM